MKILQYISLCVCLLFGGALYSQNDTLSTRLPKRKFAYKKANNIMSLGAGTSVANADLPDAIFELNLLIGYKRRVSQNFILALEYNKFNIAFEDDFNEGFMSFDFNLEYHLIPKSNFTPYLFAGSGINAANGFENSGFKFQGGIGLELMVSDGIGLKLQADRNFLSDDLLEGVEFGADNDAYYRITFGTNIYFPLSDKPKVKDDESFINANQIEY